MVAYIHSTIAPDYTHHQSSAQDYSAFVLASSSAHPRIAAAAVSMLPTQVRLVTIPARLARPAIVSTSRADARTRALALYRQFYRSAPEIVALYAMDVPPSTLRAKFREMFERNRHVDDVAVIDVMLHKGQVDFQETINCWKQVPHILKLFMEEESPAQPTTFLDKFYATKDEGRSVTGRGF